MLSKSMNNKKEMQTTIVEVKNNHQLEEVSKEEFLGILRLVAPGTNLRSGLNGIVDAKKGALIVVDNEFVGPLLDGGFKVNCRFTSQRIIELAKMDGAIVLSKDMKRILFANTSLAPDSRIPTKETGTRHKAAERTAKMTGNLTIAISERKNEINLYYKNMKYHLRTTQEILRSSSETLQILEKQRELFDQNLSTLHQMELKNKISLRHASKVIQKGMAMGKILESQEKTLIELGNEAVALKLRIKELIKDVEKETELVIKDYSRLNLKKSKDLLSTLSYEDLIDLDNILIALGQRENKGMDSIQGWRMLSKTNISEKEIASILNKMENLNKVINANPNVFRNILDKETAEQFISELQKIKDF
jgi:diadenylate cyclase